MKIAVCLYGQPRTWKHTAKWITTQYNGEVDFFCSAKNYNNEAIISNDNGITVINQEARHLEVAEINKLFQRFNPIRQRIEQYGQFEGYGPSHYLFKSMYASLLLKQQFELSSGTKYDVVLLQRYDIVTGPDINWFSKFKANDFSHDKIYVGAPHRYFPHEAYQYGMNDWLFGGSDIAMSLLMASLINVFNPGRYNDKTADNHSFTSHVILKNICNSLGIQVLVDPLLDSRILRDSLAKTIQPTIEEIQLNWDKLTEVDK